MTQTITVAERRIHRIRARRLHRAITLVAAAVFAMIVWTISVPVLGVDLIAGHGSSAQPVGPVSIAIVPLLAGGIGWALLALLERAGTTGRRVWRIVGWVVLALSLIGPITMATSAGVLISLLLMHLAVGTTLLIGLFSAGENA